MWHSSFRLHSLAAHQLLLSLRQSSTSTSRIRLLPYITCLPICFRYWKGSGKWKGTFLSLSGTLTFSGPPKNKHTASHRTILPWLWSRNIASVRMLLQPSWLMRLSITKLERSQKAFRIIWDGGCRAYTQSLLKQLEEFQVSVAVNNTLTPDFQANLFWQPATNLMQPVKFTGHGVHFRNDSLFNVVQFRTKTTAWFFLQTMRRTFRHGYGEQYPSWKLLDSRYVILLKLLSSNGWEELATALNTPDGLAQSVSLTIVRVRKTRQ